LVARNPGAGAPGTPSRVKQAGLDSIRRINLQAIDLK
jgi:hypothetical protein